MKKIYLPLVAIATLLAFSVTVVAQRPKNIYNGITTRWTNVANWSLGRLPEDGDSILIASGTDTYIAPGTGSGTTTISLNNVIVTVQSNASLQLGNGGARFGVLALDNASAISLQGNGTTAGKIIANPNNDSRNKITIGGVVKYQSDLTYTLNAANGSGLGTIFGPAQATQFTGSGTSGFSLGTLPVVLVGFNANLVGDNKVSVQWTTQQEVSTDHFEIQRSNDGLGWKTIATVKASGYSSIQKSYSFQDPTPQTGTNLYRLRMIDLDAHFGFSGVVNVRLNLLGKVSVFPNPSVNDVTISLGHVPASSWTVSLVNHIGQVMVRKTYSKDITTVTLPVRIFPAGNYSIDITDGVSNQSSKLLIAH